MWCFVIFLVTFCSSFASPQAKNSNAILKAFVNIVEVLAKKNHLTSFVGDLNSTEIVNPASIALFSGIPHVVSSFDRSMNKIELKSSAIVTLNSIETLKSFNKLVILPTTYFELQLFVHCQDGTFNRIAKLVNGNLLITSRLDKMSIIQ